MTSQECESRDLWIIHNIQSVLSAHEQLRHYVAALQITIENATILLQGELPSMALKAELLPAVRKAGALGQVRNAVQISKPR